MSELPAIEAQHLTVSYDRVSVLWDISFTVPQKQLVAIVGPNGAGKSTFIKAILGLVKPLNGHIQILGHASHKQLRKIAYVPQRDSIDWDFPMTVEELVVQGLYSKMKRWKLTSKADWQQAHQALEKVDMLSYAKRQIDQLSVGQKQRVFLARAILQDAEIYFLDEPLAGIDSTTEKLIFDFLKMLRDQGKTVVVIHHDLKDIPTHFDWVMMLNMHLIGCGPVQEVLTPENLQKTYGQSTNIFEEAFSLSQKKISGV